jgi:hypothetical protein
VPPPVPRWGAAVRATAGAATPPANGSGSTSPDRRRPSPATAAQPQPLPLTRMHPAAGGSEGPQAPPPASPPPPPPARLVLLCDAVWPPSSGPHGLLKGALAKMLLTQATGGGGGWDGRVCWTPLALAGGWAYSWRIGIIVGVWGAGLTGHPGRAAEPCAGSCGGRQAN